MPRPSFRVRIPLPGLLLVLLLSAACSRPRFEGPQIQEPPEGFRYDANATQGRNVFPDREPLWQGAWFRLFDTAPDRHGSIFITAYPGDATHDQIRAARDAQEERYGRTGSTEYGPLEPLTVDGRPAWGWTETQYRREGEVAALEYKAVVPYDTVSYAVEFYVNQPGWMDRERLKARVRTFAVGTTEVNRTLVVAASAALLLIALWVWRTVTVPAASVPPGASTSPSSETSRDRSSADPPTPPRPPSPPTRPEA